MLGAQAYLLFNLPSIPQGQFSYIQCTVSGEENISVYLRQNYQPRQILNGKPICNVDTISTLKLSSV